MVNMPAAVRGTSPGAASSGGSAKIAVIVIAVVIADQTGANDDPQRRRDEDQSEESRQHDRAEKQKRPRAPLQAISHQQQDNERHNLRPVQRAQGRAQAGPAFPWLAR